MRLTKSVMLGLFFGALAISSIAEAGTNQCDCPSISAKGTGNSSCSATESDGTCTIDFNTFDPEIERRAFDFLSSKAFGPSVFYQRFDLQSGPFPVFNEQAALFLIQQQGAIAFADQLMIYMTVSAIENGTLEGFNQEIVNKYFAIVRDNADGIVSAFMNDSEFTRDGIRVVRGCIEIRAVEEVWMMYKAFWSVAKNSPQCQVQ